jgi:hypothetical protein
MASSSYMSGRQKYARPQAMLWSENSGTLSNGLYIPTGYEINSDKTGIISTDDFLILSDHNRSEISVNTQRIEQRKRMANGTMRSYHIADKLQMTTSWQMLPSRSHSLSPAFNQSTGVSPYDNISAGESINATEYTADGGAGGVEMLDWYENHTGPFWVFLAYDKYNNFGNNDAARTHLAQYNQVVQMYITTFDYSVVKRSGTNFDLWNVNIALEEV